MNPCPKCATHVDTAICSTCGTVQPIGAPVPARPTATGPTDLERLISQNKPARRTLKPGQLGAGIVTALVVLVVGGVAVMSVASKKAESDQMMGMLNKGETMAMSAEATNVATLETGYTTNNPGAPVQPFTATKDAPATIDGQTYTPSGANKVTLKVTDLGYCIVVTNPAVKTPVKYDSGTGSTTMKTPGICA